MIPVISVPRLLENGCTQGPLHQEAWGITDPVTQRAQPSPDDPSQKQWIAQVKNPQRVPLWFHAIDQCLALKGANGNQLARCDAALTFNNRLYLIELKEQRANWIPHALDQLESTLHLWDKKELQAFSTRKVFVCNRLHPSFQVISLASKKRFKRYNTQVHIGAVIAIK